MGQTLKRLLPLVGLGLFLSLVAPTRAITSYQYSADIVIANTSATTYTNKVVAIPLNGNDLISGGFADADMLNVTVRAPGEVATAHTVRSDGTDWLLWLDSIPANSSLVYTLYTGIAPDETSFATVDGTATATSAASLNPGTTAFTVGATAAASLPNGEQIMCKQLAYCVDTLSGNVRGIVWDQLTVNQTAQDTDNGLDSSTNTRIGQRIDSLTASIGLVSFYLKKSGSPTGTAYARIRAVADDSIIAEMGSLDVSTLTTSYVWHNFYATTASISATNVRLLIEYTGGDGANQVVVGAKGSNVTAGSLTSYASPTYSDNAAADLTFRYAPGAIATVARPTTETSISMVYNGALGSNQLALTVNSTTANATAANYNVTSTEDLTVYSGTRWAKDISYAAGAAESLWCGDVDTGVCTDLSGSNDATVSYNYSSNPTGVTVTVSGLVSSSVTVNVASSESPSSVIPQAPGSAGQFQGSGTGASFPLGDVISDLSGDTPVPSQVLWAFIFMVVGMAAGLGVYVVFKSVEAAFIAAVIVMLGGALGSEKVVTIGIVVLSCIIGIPVMVMVAKRG